MPYQKNLFKRASADKGESAAGEASQEGEGEEDGEAAEWKKKKKIYLFNFVFTYSI